DRPVGFFLSGSVPAQLRQRLPAGARIHAPGAQSAPSVLATVKACSFGIYPTLVENYSMALLEAALAGVPMVTTAVGGNGEIVAHGVNGFLSADISAAALCGLALPLLDPAAAAAMRAATLADAAQRLSAAGVGARVVAAVTGAGR
ncbi:MAG: glycosyltransferase, partial [Actinomycetota bacterium]